MAGRQECGALRQVAALGVAGGLLAAAPAMAGLGSFGPADGYSLSVFSGSYNWADVAYYNAGAHGPNSGGGPGPTLIAPDSGQWRQVSNAGGFFPNMAARTAALGSAPPYPTSHPSGVPAYLVGNHFPGRNNDGSNLAIRNDTPAGSGPVAYDYDLDIYDTGGVVASTQTTGVVSFQVYFMSDPDSPPSPDGSRSDKFTMSFLDSSGNIGAQWGYSRDNVISWRDAAANPWTYTSWTASAAVWNAMKVSLDLSNDTFGLDYYDDATATWNVLVPLGASMGQSMTNFTTVRWQLEDAVSLGIGGKNFFDDATTTGFIPSPSALMVLGLAGCAAARRRR